MTITSSSAYGSGLLSQLQQLLNSQRYSSTAATSQGDDGNETRVKQLIAGLSEESSSTGCDSGGSCNAGDLQSIFRQLGGAMRDALLQAQSDGQATAGRDARLAERVAELDTDGDGQVSRDELIAGRPQNVSEDEAGALFDQIDTEKAGTLSTDALASGLKEARHHHPDGPPPGGPPPGGPPPDGAAADSSASEAKTALAALVQELDTDGDGQVSREEFLAGRPQNVSEDQAGALFDRIDTEKTGSLSTEAVENGLKALRPHHHHHGGPPPVESDTATADTAASTSSSDDSTDTTTTSTDSATAKLLAELVAQLQKATQAYGANSVYAASLTVRGQQLVA